MVRSGLVTAWRFAIWPIRRSPVEVKATIEGVIRLPSVLGMTIVSLPSVMLTQLLVVPRSIPMILLIGPIRRDGVFGAGATRERGLPRFLDLPPSEPGQ